MLIVSIIFPILIATAVATNECPDGYVLPAVSPPMHPAPAVCWGSNANNQTSLPFADAAFSFISVGESAVCGIDGAKKVWCWGIDLFGQPQVPSDLGAAVGLSVGLKYGVCAIEERANSLRCWGNDPYSVGIVSEAPTNVSVVQVSLGSYVGCAIRTDDQRAICWGDDAHQQISDIPVTESFLSISVGWYVVCGVDTSSRLHCWGNDPGAGWDLTTDVPSGSNFVSVSAGYYAVCSVDALSNANCWGWNDYGTANVPSGHHFSSASVGWAKAACGIVATSGVALCWESPSSVVTLIPDHLYAYSVSVGNGVACALKRNECTQCYPGTYKFNDTLCEACTLGSFTTFAASTCDPCPPGWYCQSPAVKVLCPGGSYCPQSSTMPVPCTSGTYSNTSGRSADCMPCDAGWYCPLPTAKYRCPAGQYCAEGSKDTSTPCPVAYFCPEGQPMPLECSTGAYCPQPGRPIDGEPCAPGYYCATPSDRLLCPAGYFCEAGSIAPVPCDRNYYCRSGSAHQSACSESCPPSKPYTISACSRIADRVCSVSAVDESHTLQVPWTLIGVAASSVILVVASSKMIVKFYPNAKPMRMFAYAFAIVDLASDLAFVVHVRNQVPWAFRLALIVLIVATVAQGWYVTRVVSKWMDRNEFRDYVFERPLWFGFVYVTAATNIESLLILTSRVFDWALFTAPLSSSDEKRIERAAMWSIIIEAVPQLAVQLYAALHLKELSGPIGFALLVSLIQVIVVVAKYGWLFVAYRRKQLQQSHEDESVAYVQLAGENADCK